MIQNEDEATAATEDLRVSGIDVLGDLPWGSHICNFYDSKEDLLEILIPYYKAGLENNEFCLWVASQLPIHEAWEALYKAIPDLQKYIDKKSIEIIAYSDWYLEDGEFNAEKVMNGWIEKMDSAVASGFDGMRVHGNESWLERDVWRNFIEYERELNTTFPNRRMIVLCTYPLTKCNASSILEVAHVHDCALAKRNGKWEILEVPAEKLTKPQAISENKRLEILITERTSLLATSNKNLTREISLHKKTLTVLERAERNYREIFEKASDAIFIIEIKTGRIIDCNAKGCLLTGYLKEELITGHPSHISSLNEGFTPADASEKIKMVTEKGDQVFEWQVKYKDGSIHWVEVSLTKADIAGKKRLLAFFHVIDDRKKAEQQLAEEKNRNQMELTDAMITAAETERQEIGRELHDNVQQLLASAKLYLGIAKKSEIKEVHPHMDEADRLLKEATVELRNLSHSMISPFIEEYGLADALDRLVDTLQKSTPLKIEKQVSKINEASMPDKLKLAIYRIAQEQFNNISKYANARNVVLKLVEHNGTILLNIKDDGVGFDTGIKSRGIGFLNIKTRASLFNGIMNVSSTPGKGCELKILFN
ncbi:MAG: MEDS domain-containing protein [Rhizobacter sp.]|nr:MEDS domain-containing protein [Ferruginibacter sp.]